MTRPRILWLILFLVVCWITLAPADSSIMHAMTAIGINYSQDHFYPYFLLAVLLGFMEPWRRAARVSVLLIVLSLVLECIQRLSPGRAFELSDLGYNIAGVILGVSTAAWIRAAVVRAGSGTPGSRS